VIPWLLLFWACTSTPPALQAQAEALADYRRAEQLRADGDRRGALAALDEAIAHRPTDVLLRAWRADLLAETDLDAAIAELDDVARAHPRFAQARYNRAAYLARQGRVEEASAELEVALRLRARSVEEARDDPDFQPHLTHPSMELLELPLSLSLSRLPDRVFRGTELEVAATVSAGGGFAIDGAAHGPIRLVRVVEDRGPASTRLVWTLDTLAAAEVRVGPVRATAEGRSPAEAAGVTVEVVGAGDDQAPAERSVALRVPSSWAEGLALARPVRRGEEVLVRVDVTDRVTVNPSVPPRSRHELRESGQPKWVTWVYPGSVEEVTVRGAGGERFSGPPTADAEDPSPR